MPYSYANTFVPPQYNQNLAGEALANRRARYEFQQVKGLNDAWAHNYDVQNQKPDTQGFLRAASAAGIGPAAAQAYLSDKLARSSTTLSTVSNDRALQTLGKDPSLDYGVVGHAGPAPEKVQGSELFLQNSEDQQAANESADWMQSPVAPSVKPSDVVGKTPAELRAGRDASPVPRSVAATPGKTPAELLAERQAAPSIPYPAGFHGPAGAPADQGMDLGQTRITAQVAPEPRTPAELMAVRQATAPAPQAPAPAPAPQAPAGAPDVIDSIRASQAPAGGQAGMPASQSFTNIFDYSKTMDPRSDIQIRRSVDATLARQGLPQGQAGVDAYLKQAADSVSPIEFKDGKPDMNSIQTYPYRQQAAVIAARDKLVSGTTEATGAQLAQDSNTMAHKAQGLAFEQVTAPGLSGHLPNPAVRAAAADASAAARGIVAEMAAVPSPTSPEWAGFQVRMAKNLVKLYNLPVGEGMVEEIGGLMQNGMSPGDAIKQMAAHGVGAGAAQAAAQVVQNVLGLNSIAGAQAMAKHATVFARDNYESYGRGKDFDKWYPEYHGQVKPSYVPKPTTNGSELNPIVYKPGMARDPKLIYRVNGKLLYGDGRPVK